MRCCEHDGPLGGSLEHVYGKIKVRWDLVLLSKANRCRRSFEPSASVNPAIVA
jgi:hypothetical protein